MTIRRMQMRRDDTLAWTTTNPALHQGEIGFEITSTGQPNRLKIGDGFTSWNDLEYADDNAMQTIREEYGDESSFNLNFDLNK